MDADLRRQLAPRPASAIIVSSASAEPLVERRHRGLDVRRSRYRSGGQTSGPWTSTAESSGAARPLGCRHVPGDAPEPREPQAGARRDRAVRRAGRDREGPAAGGGLPAHRGQRAPPRRRLGAQARASAAPTSPRRRRGPGCASRIIVLVARLFGTRSVVRPRHRPSRATRRTCTTSPALARGRRDRRRRARARRDLAALS